MHQRHYAPEARLEMVSELAEDQAGLTFRDDPGTRQIRMPADPTAYAASLYRALRKLDQKGTGTTYVETPPSGPDWEAVHDRLKKASAS